MKNLGLLIWQLRVHSVHTSAQRCIGCVYVIFSFEKADDRAVSCRSCIRLELLANS